MLTSWGLYWLFRLDSISVALCVSFFVLLVLSLMKATREETAARNEGRYEDFSNAKKTLYVALALLATAVFVPSTKEAATIYLLPKIANNEKVQELAGDSLTLLQAYVKKQLEEVVAPKEEKK